MKFGFSTSFYFGTTSGGYANIHYNDLERQHETYLKTIINFYASIPSLDEIVKILFVNDIDRIKAINNGEYYRILIDQLSVKIYQTKSNYVDEDKKWAGSMFIFDVLAYIEESSKIESINIDKWLFFDSDVLILDNTTTVLKIIKSYDMGGYGLWKEFYSFGVWTESFHGVDINKINQDMIPMGGEFLMLDKKALSPFLSQFELLYSIYKEELLTEEHYYSLIFFELKNEYSQLLANPFVKRVFQRNREKDDQYLWCAHFPGQKDYKLKVLYRKIKSKNFYYDSELAKKIMGLDCRINRYDVYNFLKLMNKITKYR